MNDRPDTGMTVRQARMLERTIIGACLLSLALVFQPFALELYSVGAVLVVVCGLAFNLVPACRPGVPVRRVLRTGVIVLVTLAVITALAISSAYLYGRYFVG